MHVFMYYLCKFRCLNWSMLSCAYLSLFLALLQLVTRKIELVLGSLSPASLYPLRAPLQWVLLLLARALALTQQVVCIMLHFFF